MITPFDDDGQVDLDGTAELPRGWWNRATTPWCSPGTTGEASVPHRRRADLGGMRRAVRSTCRSSPAAGTKRHRARHGAHPRGAAAGMDAVLIVTPYYVRVSAPGRPASRRTSVRSPRPRAAGRVLYDIPVRTGRNRCPPRCSCASPTELPNVVALKDAAGDIPPPPSSSPRRPTTSRSTAGDDAFTLPLLSVVPSASISVPRTWAAGP